MMTGLTGIFLIFLFVLLIVEKQNRPDYISFEELLCRALLDGHKKCDITKPRTGKGCLVTVEINPQDTEKPKPCKQFFPNYFEHKPKPLTGKAFPGGRDLRHKIHTTVQINPQDTEVTNE